MTEQKTIYQPQGAAFELSLLPDAADKDTTHRVNKFLAWMKEQGLALHSPDMAAYRDYLLESYAPSSVQAHLSTVRNQYKRLAKDNATREGLYQVAPGETAADRKAFVDEVLIRMMNAANADSARVKVVKHQDVADSAHIRLTREQAEALLRAPGVDTLAGLRDTAIIALLLCTGIREAELRALDVDDLRQELGGELALHVRKGKGAKARLIPYGELNWCLVIVDRWLGAAGIDAGPVFRGFYKGGKRLRPGRMTTRSVRRIIPSYPVAINGEMVQVKPHDLRRTYARRLYEAGTDTLAIQQNLGHAISRTTEGYIGTLDADSRRAPGVYSFDLGALNGAPKQAKMEL